VIPLAVGLRPDQTYLVDLLKKETAPGARILLEDRPNGRDARWTALLPLLTGRTYLGGIDPDGWIEHSFARLCDNTLAGRSLDDWNAAELDAFCRRYDVGWVVCSSPAAVAKLKESGRAEETRQLPEGDFAFFVRLKPASYFLKGRGDIVSQSRDSIVIANVVPEGGVILLSQHHQSGMRAFPARVQVERDVDPWDPIPFVRLRMDGPVDLLTLKWEDH
jgi:hypothetical protein